MFVIKRYDLRSGLGCSSVAAVDQLSAGGLDRNLPVLPLERCWRDVHMAAQLVQVQDGRWETAGRVLLGLDPASPLV